MTGFFIGLMIGWFAGGWAVYFLHEWIWRD